ncbi:hypothetical protein BKA70DRAFT_594437 [Coprinopsis sp. MPI-PUGE-AT-0042]|nr:hypothetical protein BKA70DRAFT_594437 [Coprinopsis sp. MPI-PUGE-AT-0042]
MIFQDFTKMLKMASGYVLLVLLHMLKHGGMVVMICFALTVFSISTFLVVRYQQGDQPPRPTSPIACWYLIAISIVTILSCVIAPFFETLRRFRWIFWVGALGLWVGGYIVLDRTIGYKQEEGKEYCDIVQITHCTPINVILNLTACMCK